MKKWISLLTVAVLAAQFCTCNSNTKIDREALVGRHTVTLDSLSATELLQAGNGEIAYGIDATLCGMFFD
jgi:hypothetical protein